MKKAIPLTAATQSNGVSLEHQRFLSSLDRAMQKTLASGKIKILRLGDHKAAPPQPEPALVPAPAPIAQASAPRERHRQGLRLKGRQD